jgi:SAM-dependent methyltransferase
VPPNKSGRLLDIGSGDGRFLEAAREAGWQVAGLEIHPDAVAAGYPLFRTLEEASHQAPYECITLWHVLEHIPNPADYVSRLRRMLEPEGVLLMAVPDFGGFQARLFGRHWLHLDVPRHLYHFTAPALWKLLDTAGFEVLRTWHQELEYDCFGWIQSALNAVTGTPNILFDALTGKPRRVGRFQVAANYAALPALGVPALALTAAATLARQGSTLIVAARPKSS